MSKHHKSCKWENYIAMEFLPCPFCRIEELEERLAIEKQRWQTFPVDILEAKIIVLEKALTNYRESQCK